MKTKGYKGSHHKNPDGSNGGYVESTARVQSTVYVSPESQVLGYANVYENARIEGRVIIAQHANVSGNVVIQGTMGKETCGVFIGGESVVRGNAVIMGNARISGLALVEGYARIEGSARIRKQARVTGYAVVKDHAIVEGSVFVGGKTIVSGSTHLSGHLMLLGDTRYHSLKPAGRVPPLLKELNGRHLETISQVQFLGQGGYGKVQGADTYVLKTFHEQNGLIELRKLQKKVNAIEPSRQFLGGKVIEFHPNYWACYMQNDGLSLDIFLEKTSKPTIKEFKMVLKHFPDLFKAVQILVDHRFVHGDIKLPNVVIHPDTGRMKLIDYDFLGSFEEVEQDRVTRENETIFPDIHAEYFYYIWPLERYWFLDGFVFNRSYDTRTSIEELYSLHMFEPDSSDLVIDYYMDPLRRDSEAPQSLHLQRFVEYYTNAYVKKSRNIMVPSKIDIYSIGLIAYKSLRRFFSSCHGLETLCQSLVHPDPMKRPVPQEMIPQWIECVHHAFPKL